MKSLFLALMLTLSMPFAAFGEDTAASQNNPNITFPAPEENLLDDKIYFFAHSMCQNCRDAFVHIYDHHADLNIPITDMKFHHNFELYKQCVKKFSISNKELRLPLICMGNHYIMGWDNSSPELFETYLQEFQTTTSNKE